MRRAAAELEQPIGDVDGGEGLARAGGHLDEGARVAPGEGFLEITNGAGLDRPQPRLVERRQALQAGAQLRGLRHPLRQRFRAREVEHAAAARRGVESVREVGHRTVGLEQEGQRALVRGEVLRQAGGVFRRLLLDAGQGALRLGLHRAHRLAVQIEQVVRETEAGPHRELAHGDPPAGGEVDVLAVLHQPTGGREVSVDPAAGFLFGRFRHGSLWLTAPAWRMPSGNVLPCSGMVALFAPRSCVRSSSLSSRRPFVPARSLDIPRVLQF